MIILLQATVSQFLYGGDILQPSISLVVVSDPDLTEFQKEWTAGINLVNGGKGNFIAPPKKNFQTKNVPQKVGMQLISLISLNVSVTILGISSLLFTLSEYAHQRIKFFRSSSTLPYECNKLVSKLTRVPCITNNCLFSTKNNIRESHIHKHDVIIEIFHQPLTSC